MPNLQRRRLAVFAFALAAPFAYVAQAAEPQAFEDKAFRAAQAAGKPVMVDIYASW